MLVLMDAKKVVFMDTWYQKIWFILLSFIFNNYNITIINNIILYRFCILYYDICNFILHVSNAVLINFIIIKCACIRINEGNN